MRRFVVKHLPSTFTWACVYVMCISIADVLGTRVNNSSGQQNFMKTFHNEANTPLIMKIELKKKIGRIG